MAYHRRQAWLSPRVPFKHGFERPRATGDEKMFDCRNSPPGRIHRFVFNYQARRVALLEPVVVSFGTGPFSTSRSFPRKRESTSQTFANALPAGWIPALRQAQGKLFAGMTCERQRPSRQMTPLTRNAAILLCYPK
jgi:hypothetical protein